jgi:hypothetical protein
VIIMGEVALFDERSDVDRFLRRKMPCNWGAIRRVSLALSSRSLTNGLKLEVDGKVERRHIEMRSRSMFQ